MWSSLFPEPYKTDFTEETFKLFASIFDEEYISKKVLEIYPWEDVYAEPLEWIGRERNTQTDLNIVRQFLSFSYAKHTI
jgi:hypothetical protein